VPALDTAIVCILTCSDERGEACAYVAW
jgi:hypothetical protein